MLKESTESIRVTEAAAKATLERFYAAESAYLQASNPDFAAIAATLDPECVIYQPASLPYGGEWRGHAGFEVWMQKFSQAWTSLAVQGSELFVFGEVIVSRSHVYAEARANQRKADWPLLQMFRLRESRIRELRPFYWDTAALLNVLDPSLSVL